jgi:molybdopterin-guanine dinucleotide biosynthesis protein A
MCGGQSTRMGADKGLLKLQETSWAQIAAEKLIASGLPVLFSVNESQYPSYLSFFSPAQLIKDDTSLNIKGPLCGVLSVHLKNPGEDLLIVACDLPLMDINLLKELINQHKQATDEAIVFTNDNTVEPLCAIYTSAGLSKIYRLHLASQLSKHSMKYMLEQLTVHKIALKEYQLNSFKNFNAHADLNGL